MMYHNWFVALHVQYCIVGIPLCHLLLTRPKATAVALGVVSVLSAVLLTVVLYVNRYPPTLLPLVAEYSKTLDYLSFVYGMPYTHLAPFCLGLLLGCLLVQDSTPTLTSTGVYVGNMVAMLLMFLAVFGCYPFRAGLPVPFELIACYGGFHRLLWTLAVCWFIYVSQTGQGGVISSFLSADFFQPLSSLSFLVYLLHPIVILVHIAMTKERQQFDHFYMAVFYLGVLTMSNMAAYLAHIIVELPFAGIERLFKTPPKPLDDSKKPPEDSEDPETISTVSPVKLANESADDFASNRVNYTF